MFQKRPKPYFGHKSQVYLPTPRDKKTFKFPWKMVRFFLFLVFVAALVYLLFYSPYFSIQDIRVEGTKNQEIQNTASLVKGKNLWLFDKKKLEEDLLKYAEISQVQIKRWPLKTLKIKIVEKAEGIVWQTGEKKYLLDIQGVVTRVVEESNLPAVNDLKNAPVEIGKPVVTPLFVNFVKNLNLKFTPKTGLPLNEISVPAETTFEIIVKTERFKVIFDTQGDLDAQLDNLTRVYQVKKDEIKEYMDLRIEGRVYYK